MEGGWVGFAYACLEWLQGWGKWQLAAFFVWVGLVWVAQKHGWPWKRARPKEVGGA